MPVHGTAGSAVRAWPFPLFVSFARSGSPSTRSPDPSDRAPAECTLVSCPSMAGDRPMRLAAASLSSLLLYGAERSSTRTPLARWGATAASTCSSPPLWYKVTDRSSTDTLREVKAAAATSTATAP
ncbi:hypothetical protein [Streptomyces sp. MJM1172]|uniref:hypothetical protein n=1 Tax=Streptomyces sp. MJM1172 TaxID=1703926 RepID=UPI00093AE056|nr:hypothetical protein [Streptomyces sp. MJM1172]OKI50945.1 hypothetical protein AMK15_31655 [Streptomyces sp. MJM1172]